MIAHPSEPAEAAYSEPPTVHLDLTRAAAAVPAPHLRRLIALVVDVAGVSAVIGVAAILGAAVDLFDPVWFAWVFVIVLVYYLGVSVWLTGQTAGKAVCGLTVRRGGTTVPANLSGFAWSVGRHSIGYVVIDVFGLGALLALINRRRRCLHDYVFGSEVVVRVPVGTSVDTPAARMEDFQTRFKAGLAELDRRYEWLFFLGRWLSKVVAVVAALLLFVASWPAEVAGRCCDRRSGLGRRPTTGQATRRENRRRAVDHHHRGSGSRRSPRRSGSAADGDREP